MSKDNEFDQRILEILRLDSRKTFVEIGKELGLSEFSSIVNLDIKPSSIRFLILRLIADSDRPSSFPISTNDFLESNLRISRIR